MLLAHNKKGNTQNINKCNKYILHDIKLYILINNYN